MRQQPKTSSPAGDTRVYLGRGKRRRQRVCEGKGTMTRHSECPEGSKFWQHVRNKRSMRYRYRCWIKKEE